MFAHVQYFIQIVGHMEFMHIFLLFAFAREVS